MRSVRANRGTEIEHDGFPIDRWPYGSNRGPLDPRHGLELEFRHGHKGSGVAGGHGSIGFSLLHRVDGEPHRRFPAPFAEGQTRLVVHLDGDIRVHDMGACLELRAGIEQWLKSGAIAKKQKFNIGVARERKLSSWNNDRSAVVPPPWLRGRGGLGEQGGAKTRWAKDDNP